MEPKSYVPMRAGRHYPYLCPAGSFQGPQGWIVILCTEWQVKNLWNAVGRPELSDDPRFDTNPHRVDNRDEVTSIIERWMATFSTDEDVMRVLEEHRVPHGPTLSPADALSHPHFLARGVVRTVQDPLAGEVQIPGFPFRTTEPLPDRDLIAPALGEHNDDVLRGLLGYSEDRVEKLRRLGVIDEKPH
jgi:crotonobetainyl-CoA:carnitine CoA-transferase CaiB-like acyl-CoA transferase